MCYCINNHGAVSFPRNFVFQEMGYNAPGNWQAVAFRVGRFAAGIAWTICVVCTNIGSAVCPRRLVMPVATSTARTARLGLRATPEQETVLRRAAEVAHKSLTDFILDAAYQAAEQALLDQRLFMVSGSQYQAILEMLDRPESDNPGLVDLFSRRPVWANK